MVCRFFSYCHYIEARTCARRLWRTWQQQKQKSRCAVRQLFLYRPADEHAQPTSVIDSSSQNSIIFFLHTTNRFD